VKDPEVTGTKRSGRRTKARPRSVTVLWVTTKGSDSGWEETGGGQGRSQIEHGALPHISTSAMHID
jgi:hypothetical protein